MVILRGCFRILFLYDVGEALDLERLRELLGPRGGTVKRVFPRRTPEYVQFEHAPVVESAQPLDLATGERVLCSIKYYAFAVVVVQFEVPFEGDWDSLLARASRWTDAADVEPQARQIVVRHLDAVAARARGLLPLPRNPPWSPSCRCSKPAAGMQRHSRWAGANRIRLLRTPRRDSSCRCRCGAHPR